MKKHIIFLNCIIFLLLLNAKGQTQTVTIVSDITQICNGSSVTFTASENFNPMDNNLYPIGTEWEVSHDGGVSFANIPGQYQSTFTTSSLLNNDEVRAKSRYFSFSDYSQFEIISNQIQVQVNSSPKADINTISTAKSGSIKFNGSNQYLTLSNPLNYSTDAFTIDGWFRLDAPPANVAPIIGAEGYGNPSVLIQSNLNTIVIDVYQHHGDFFTVPTITIGAWHHLVVVRNSSSDLTVFLDGQRSSTGAITESYSFTSTDNANVGKFQGNYFSGFLSNLRIITGSDLYDPTQTTITIPTSLTTADANTKLLLNAVNASSLLTDGSGTQSSITNNGNAIWSGGSPLLDNLNSNSNATISNATIGGVWSSSNNSILQVNSSGVLTPIVTGNATITYTVTSNAPFTCVSTESTLLRVTINTQNFFTRCNATWSKQNLDVTTYNDGTPIPQVTDFSTLYSMQTGAWMYYNNIPGPNKLYNWYAVAGIYDAQSLSNPALRKQIAPTGWRVPTDVEWNKLTKCFDANADTSCLNCNASSNAGDSLKNIGLINAYLGSCNYGGCGNDNLWQNYWTSSSYDNTYAIARYINKDQSSLQRYIQYAEKYHGFSVPLIQDLNSTGDTTVTVCGSFVWYGQTYTTSGTPTHTFTNANGYDSVVTLHLTIKTPTSSTETITACGSYSWHGASYTASTNSVALGDSYQGGKVAYILQPGDQGYNANTVKGFIVPITSGGQIGSSDFGCNSTLVNGANGSSIGSGNQNTIDILNGCSGASAAESCNSYAVTENNIVYDDWYLPSRDEMHQIALNSNLFGGLQPWFYWTSTQTNNSQAYCVITQGAPTDAVMGKGFDAYRLPIRNFSVAKPPTWTGTNAAGCDSVVTLHLTINNSTSSVETISSAVPYVWHGVTYASSTNTPTWNTTNAAGCDSVVTLHLTITCSPNTGDTTATACGSFVWYGVNYNSSVTPTHTFTNARGCDSVVTLHLTIQSVVPTKPASITQTLLSNVCGARVYRYSASVIANGLQYVWVLPNSLGGDNSAITLDSGTINSKTILVKYISNNAASTTDSIKVASYNGCMSSYTAVKLTITSMKGPAVPTTFTGVVVKAASCGARTYRMIAPSLPLATSTLPAATGYIWSFVGNLSNYIAIDSGTVNSQIIVIKCSSNEAAAIGDSIRLCYTSVCGNSPWKSIKMSIVKLAAPSAPTLYSTNSLVSNECGARVYRYSASSFTSGYSSVGDPTGYIWSFTGSLGANAVLDSGTINSQTIRVKFTSNAAAAADDSVRVAFTSGCGNSIWRSLKLTNTLLDVPAAPVSVTIALVSDICGARVYRYTAPVLTAASTTRAAATGYVWKMPFGTVGATGVLDSGSLSGQTIKIRYSSNDAALTGDSIKVQFTSACGNSLAKAQKLSNVAAKILAAPTSLTGTTSICSIVGTENTARYTSTAVAGAVSYLWTIPSGAVIDSGSSGLKIKVRFNSAGPNDSIYVQAVGTNGCVGTKKVLKLVTTSCATIPTSRVSNPVTTTEESMQVSVFPNPSRSNFNLQVLTAGNEPVKARVLDMQGRIIKSLVIAPNHKISIGSELKAGVYFIEITRGNEIKTMRVVKY